jgi:ATP-dependent Lon protease
MPRNNNRKNTVKKTKPDDDNSSVDSKGNIRGLIDYNYKDSASDDDFVPSDDEMILAEPGIVLRKVPARKAKTKAMKSIAESIQAISMSDTPATLAKTPTSAPPSKKKKVEPQQQAQPRQRTIIYDFRMDPSESEEEEYDEEEEEDESEYIDSDDMEDDDEPRSRKSSSTKDVGDIIAKMFDDGRTPRRHNMKKESDIVKNFVKLITAPLEDTNIDTQIDQFKSLPDEKQREIIGTLESRPPATDVNSSLMFKILDMKLPTEIRNYILAKYQSLEGMDPTNSEYFKSRNWLEKVCAVPFGKFKEMPVQLSDGPPACEQFMKSAKKALDEAVFGQTEAKLQILQFIATKISNPSADGISLLLIGPPGVGKTSLIKNGIAKALQWPFQFVSLGGETDASTYTGHQLVYEGSHAGKIANSIISAKSMSFVMMFDELDKISNTPKGEEIQHMLVHLTDPVQNMHFEDKYLANIPINLSKVMFVFSANDINKIDRILLDRMRVIQLKGYDLQEKIKIAETFLVPEALATVNLVEKVHMSQDVVRYIIEQHAKEDAGVRELKRSIEQIVQKINMLRMYNSKELSFHIPEFHLPFIVKKEHVDLFIKKKAEEDDSFRAMYV